MCFYCVNFSSVLEVEVLNSPWWSRGSGGLGILIFLTVSCMGCDRW